MECINHRRDVPVAQTWDLTPIFSDDQAFSAAFEAVETKVDQFVDQYKDRLDNAPKLVAALDALEQILIPLTRVESYASLSVAVDMTDREAMKRAQMSELRLSRINARLSFLENAILALPEEALEEAKKTPAYTRYLEKLIQKKKRLLSPDVEETLSAFAPVLQSPYRLYETMKFTDIQFDDFIVGDKVYQMSYPVFENRYEGDTDPKVRRAAAETFYAALERYQNTTAEVYYTLLQREKIESRLRGYDSVIDFLLDEQEVSRDLYNRQIDGIMKDLAPVMRRYAQLLKEKLGLSEITTYDLKAELDPTFHAEISFADAKTTIMEGLSLLGPGYQEVLRRAFDERWIDYAENLGKQNGAFAAGVYDVHPYVMTSFNGQMDEVATLAHELGHVGQDFFTSAAQNFLNTDLSMYIVEVPSTTNELLMENALLEKAGDDVRMRRWIISQMIAKTYYHNFVTHGLEAAFQREVYLRIDAGETIDASILRDIYREVLQRFWGDTVVIEEPSTLLWMRQPHYYMGLYSYTYSASLTIGTQVALSLLKAKEQGESTDAIIAGYQDFLAAGGTKTPFELAQLAGVDISTGLPLQKTIEYIDSLISELEK